MSKVLVVAVHPDDETLGCGGTLLKHKKNGDEINWLIVTEMKVDQGFLQKRIDIREKEIDFVSKKYGFQNTINLKLPTTFLDKISPGTIVNRISKVIREIKPEIIYLPFMGDVHSDHRIIFEAVYSCTKRFRYPYIEKILMMETISETEFSSGIREEAFSPNYFVNITGFIDKKIEIMKLYKGEIKHHPFPRSVKNIKALATFRGATSGCKYAESFMLLKEIVK